MLQGEVNLQVLSGVCSLQPYRVNGIEIPGLLPGVVALVPYETKMSVTTSGSRVNVSKRQLHGPACSMPLASISFMTLAQVASAVIALDILNITS